MESHYQTQGFVLSRVKQLIKRTALSRMPSHTDVCGLPHQPDDVNFDRMLRRFHLFSFAAWKASEGHGHAWAGAPATSSR